MWKNLIRVISGKDCELRERMFRAIILVGGIAAIIGTVQCFFMFEMNIVFLLPLLFLVLVMGMIMFVAFKYRKYDMATVLLGLVIIVIVFPIMFCVSGGIDSGAAIWWALGVFYIFAMFQGKRLVFFLILCLVSYVTTYTLAYNFPNLIVPMSDEWSVYVDSLFSVFVVGTTAGMLLKYQMKIFELEHLQNLEQKKEIEKASSTKNAFFANMSHEIRMPLNTIIGLNEMILRANPTDEAREYSEDIQMASSMLLKQVNDILDLSQMEMKKMKIVPAQYETAELFNDLIEMIRVQAAKKNLVLYSEIDQSIPSVLLGDEKRIKQVLLNILDNAVKYTEKGSITLSVQGEKAGDEVLLRVKVSDTGIGIRKEDMEHIYDSFNRVDERKNSGIIGSGLGLAITKQLIDLMDGEITIDSIYTKGSIFTVSLKQKIIDAKPIGKIQEKEKRDNAKIYKPSFQAPEARVLIVDDNIMNSMVASKLLSSTKVQVDVANSGAKCLELTRKKYYHVILMDYLMPIMDGYETLKEVRKQENGLCRDSAVIAVTGNALQGGREVYQEKGFDGYVEKPISGKLLEAEILKFLPDEIVEQLAEGEDNANGGYEIQKVIGSRRKKVCITADCACDIPPELLEKYDIKLMHLYIKTPNGRFADIKEIDSDSLKQYMSVGEDTGVYADSATVEEYEEFFADMLTRAERVIHVTLASNSGESYKVAVMAAKSFDNVTVVDSGQVSGGQGILTLYAARLAMEGKRADEIYELVEKAKGKIRTRAILPRAAIFYRNGRMRYLGAKISNLFQLHPMVEMRQGKAVVTGLLGGSLENAWRQGIRWHLKKRRKVDRSIVIITHVGCTVKQQEWLKNEVLKCVKFENVIVQKASFTTACNSGIKTIGVAYCRL